MNDEIRFRNGERPSQGGFATPHVPGLPENEPEGEVNDSLGSVHPADTMDTDPDDDPEAGGKGVGEKVAE
ncbi:MAG TPA: hypothetical protein VL346_13015 [Acidobacteriaceae bacterium]|nr:hypothetical protein [Acidobacteriaceae bacterium]